MPNWCSNVLYAVTESSQAELIKTSVSGPDHEGNPMALSFARIVPEPESSDEPFDWHAWRINNWGTKWDLESPSFCEWSIEGTDQTALAWIFDTAWSPPYGIFQALEGQFPSCRWVMEYFEPGMEFAGVISAGHGQDPLSVESDQQLLAILETEDFWLYASWDHFTAVGKDEAETAEDLFPLISTPAVFAPTLAVIAPDGSLACTDPGPELVEQALAAPDAALQISSWLDYPYSPSRALSNWLHKTAPMPAPPTLSTRQMALYQWARRTNAYGFDADSWQCEEDAAQAGVYTFKQWLGIFDKLADLDQVSVLPVLDRLVESELTPAALVSTVRTAMGAQPRRTRAPKAKPTVPRAH